MTEDKFDNKITDIEFFGKPLTIKECVTIFKHEIIRSRLPVIPWWELEKLK